MDNIYSPFCPEFCGYKQKPLATTPEKEQFCHAAQNGPRLREYQTPR